MIKCKNRNKRRELERKLTPAKIKQLKAEGNLWHRRMGHISAEYVHKMATATIGIPEVISIATITNCQVCAKAKLTRKSFNKDRDRAKRVGEIVHADLIGPITPITFVYRNKLIVSIIDDYSRFLQVFTIKQKTETATCLNEGYCNLGALYPSPGQFNLLQCDNGPEFTCKETNEIHEVRIDPTEAYCHQHLSLIHISEPTRPY